VQRADRKCVVVTRKTRIQDLVAKYHTESQAKFYVEHLGADFTDYEAEHRAYVAALSSVTAALERRCRYQLLDRLLLPNYLFAPDDIVIALGQDGVVANTMKYLEGQPLVGVNPDPRRYDGILLPFEARDVGAIVDDLLARNRPCKSVTLAQAALSDGQVLYAVNDLFLGPKSHTSARYELECAGKKEVQSSSGVIVATGLGSTAWLKSIVTGSTSIADAYRSNKARSSYQPIAWDADYLQFVVREPFPSISSAASLVFGRVDKRAPLIVRSLMPDNGVIFSDGIEADFLSFTSGSIATIRTADRTGRLVQ
jgi:NAD kinase